MRNTDFYGYSIIEEGKPIQNIIRLLIYNFIINPLEKRRIINHLKKLNK